MEKTVVLTKLDFRTLKYCNLFILKYQRKTKLWFIIASVFLVAIAVYDVFFNPQENKNYLIAILSVLFLLYSGYQFFNLEKRLDTQLARFFYNRRVTTQTVEVTDEKVIVTRSIDKDNPIETDWSYVTEICEMPQFYMLMVGRGAPIIIDRSNEAVVSGSQETLDEIIKSKASSKPYKKVEGDIVKNPITFVHPEFPEVVEESVVEEEKDEEKSEENVEEIGLAKPIDEEERVEAVSSLVEEKEDEKTE